MNNCTSVRRALYVCAVTLLLLPRAVATAPADVILRASTGAITGTAWRIVSDATAAGGARLASPNAGAAKIGAPLASPASYVELTFTAEAGTPYRLWLRMQAERNSWANDSVYVQFSSSLSQAGTPAWRIGTTSGLSVTLEDCANCGVSGWGWQDDGFGAGVLGEPVYFAASGTQRIRFQVREDGVSIDQVVLSPATYFNSPPGALKNDSTILTGTEPAPPPAAITLYRQPYLQQVTADSAVIVWASREPGPASARVGSRTIAAATEFFPAAATGLTVDYYQHVAAVTGLSPATTYAYDVFVGDAAGTSGTDRLTTAPPTGTGTVRFIAFGDSGTGSAEQKTLASLMASDTFDLAIHAGDLVYGNSGGTGDASYRTYQSWFFDIYKAWLRRRPMFPSNGNHDSRSTTSWGAAYLDVFVLPENGASGAYPDHAERYYSYDYGRVHFVALDTERAFADPARRAAQLAWLEADLAASTQPWKVAYYHRAAYSAGGEHGSDLAVRQAFGPLFERYGVQLVIAGHQHDYERSVPWRESADTARQAVTYVVAGGGGAPLYSAGQDAWTASSRAAHHYLRTTITDCVARIEAVGLANTVFDAVDLNRCDQASDAAPPTVAFSSPAAGGSVAGTVVVEADAWDDTAVAKVDLWVDGQLRAIDLEAPYAFSWNTAAEAPGGHALELRAVDQDGKRAAARINVTVGSAPPGAGEIVLRASDVTTIAGAWTRTADATAADGVRLWTANNGTKLSASASPASYFEVPFDAVAGTPYHLWLRMKADNNSWANDSVYAQFSGSVDAGGNPVFRIGTTGAASVTLEEGVNAGVHGWGWNDNTSGGMAGPIYFATTGRQTLRIQVREDGASVDQVVLSPGAYLNASPGALKDDATVVAR